MSLTDVNKFISVVHISSEEIFQCTYSILHKTTCPLDTAMVHISIFRRLAKYFLILDPYYRISNGKKSISLQNNLLTAVICRTNSHLNTAAVVVYSIVFFGWKSIEIWENNDITSCKSRKWLSFITILHFNLPMWATFIKSIGSLIGEAWTPSLHHLGRIFGSKNWFLSTNTKWMIAKTSSHHSSTHSSVKNSHTNFGLIMTLLTIWVWQVLDKNCPKWHSFSFICCFNHLKPEFLV